MSLISTLVVPGSLADLAICTQGLDCKMEAGIFDCDSEHISPGHGCWQSHCHLGDSHI
jgi:hypothetical protein